MKSQHIVSSSYLAPSSPASEFIFDVCKFSDRPFIHNYNIMDVLYGSLKQSFEVHSTKQLYTDIHMNFGVVRTWSYMDSADPALYAVIFGT